MRNNTADTVSIKMQNKGKIKRHNPQRTCIGCREEKDKSELLRLTAGDNGAVIPDESKRAQGRGAYICKKTECLEKAIKTKAFDRALKLSSGKNDFEKLREYFEVNFGEERKAD